MTTAELELVFDGPAVQDGRIEARLLADSLAGYSQVFTRANALINGELSTAAVLVEAEFRRGSFVAGLELVQNLTEQAVNLISAHPFLDASALAAIVGFVPKEIAKEAMKDIAKETVISLYKWLKGKRPDSAEKTNQDEVKLKSGEETKTVNVNVFNLYGDSAIRLGLDRLTSPLREAAVDRISVRAEQTEQTLAEKSEAEYFQVDTLQPRPEAQAMEGQREATLVVAKLSFKEGSNWTFFERGATVVAKIEDLEFWAKVHNHELTFGEGDLLRVRLSWSVQRTRHQLKQRNTVTRVLEKVELATQMQFGSAPETKRRIKTKG